MQAHNSWYCQPTPPSTPPLNTSYDVLISVGKNETTGQLYLISFNIDKLNDVVMQTTGLPDPLNSILDDLSELFIDILNSKVRDALNNVISPIIAEEMPNVVIIV